MNYLVDSHILLWSLIESKRLSGSISRLLINEENIIYYSPINLWEISIKYELKKIDLRGISPDDFFDALLDSFFVCKEINNFDLITSYKLPKYHKDPFDRFLIWEAIRNDFILMSVDKTMDLYKKEGLKVIY
jgi:PIN domain nuclease of toxin-antitoxin system